MFGKLTHLRNQRGFTMAEVVMAALIFTASVVGISGMLISGSANVTRGATETAAINLANRRLEEVKSLSYYIPWDPAKGNQDIDDFYYNTDQANGVTADEGQHPQLDHPRVVEDYGTISGFPKFKRKTAVEYQYVSTLSGANSMEPGGTKHLAPAVMCKNSPYNWVPNSPVTGQTDDPRGGDRDIATDEIHALVVEVSVYYNLDGAERVYKERSLVGALTTSGAYNQPYLLIQSINPTEGEWNDTTFQMTIMVKASTEFNDTANVDVRLWRTGTTDIPADSSSVSADGTRVTSNFNLSNPAIKIGVSYNISVYWKQGGWTDIFRSCFQVVQSPPGITSLTTPADSTNPQAWGYAAQTARQVIIKGDHLSNPTSVVLRDPSSSTQISGTVVNVPGTTDSHTIVATFNLASTTATKSISSKYWNVMVTTAGGNDTSSRDSERLLLNPNPPTNPIQITEVIPEGMSAGHKYFDWAYGGQTARKVRIRGSYLYGLEMDGRNTQYPADCSATLWLKDTENKIAIARRKNLEDPGYDPDGGFVDALDRVSNTSVDINDFRSDTDVVMGFDFSESWNTATDARDIRDLTNYPTGGVPVDIRIANYGTNGSPPAKSTSDSGRVRLNPKPVIDTVTATNISASPNYFSWAHGGQTSRNMRIEGHYLYGCDEDQYYYSARLVPLPPKQNNSSYWTTSKATMTPGQWGAQTQSAWDNEWDETRPIVLTFYPSTSSFAKDTSQANIYWNVRLENNGNDSSTAAYSKATATTPIPSYDGTPSTDGVYMNPKPHIDAISDTNTAISPPYFKWAQAAQTARNVRIEGYYLYALDQSDTTVQLEYGGNRTPKATFTAGQNPALYEVYTDTKAVMTFNPSLAPGIKSSGHNGWNVEVTNYGGQDKSNGVTAKQVDMNPAPVISAVTATSSPNYFNWAYLSQASRNVRVKGDYLYGLDQTADSQISSTLKYTTSGTTYETATEGTVVSGQTDPNLWDRTTPVILTFYPNSALPTPTTATYDKYWDVNIKNYGGTTLPPTANSQRVYMNPKPSVASIQVYNNTSHAYDAFSTAKTGSAADANYKVGNVYTVGITGMYLQPNSSINLALGTASPVTGTTTYVPLTGGTVSADGTSIAGLTMDVSVNPMTTASFMKWGGSTLQSDNTKIAGTYHLIFVNPGDPYQAPDDRTLTLTHATFTVTATSKQTAWGSVSPASQTGYQDQSATVTATPTTSSPAGQYQFVAWQSGGTDFSSSNPITFTDSANHTIQARFLKKLYWSTDGTTNANWASFVTGYSSGTGTTFTPMDTGESALYPSMYIYASGGYNREIAGVTNSTVSLVGASKLCIDWKQVNNAYSALVVSTNKTSGYGTYNTYLAHPNYSWAPAWPGTRPQGQAFVESSDSPTPLNGYVNVSSYQGTYYIRVHSRTPSSGTYGSNTSTIRVYRVWLE